MAFQLLVSSPQTLFDIGHRILRLDLHTEKRAGETIQSIVYCSDKYVEFVWGHFEFLSISNTFGHAKVQQRCVIFSRKFLDRRIIEYFCRVNSFSEKWIDFK